MVWSCVSEGDPLLASSGVTDPGHREPLSQVSQSPTSSSTATVCPGVLGGSTSGGEAAQTTLAAQSRQ